MQRLITMLDEGGYSCVIDNGGDIRCFTRRGVADLYHLYTHEKEYLLGAKIADKVVGKGAAALMAAGGIDALYTHTISESAYELLASYGARVEYGQMVDHIINRDGSGWCPIETRCRAVVTAEECIREITRFLAEMNSVK